MPCSGSARSAGDQPLCYWHDRRCLSRPAPSPGPRACEHMGAGNGGYRIPCRPLPGASAAQRAWHLRSAISRLRPSTCQTDWSAMSTSSRASPMWARSSRRRACRSRRPQRKRSRAIHAARERCSRAAMITRSSRRFQTAMRQASRPRPSQGRARQRDRPDRGTAGTRVLEEGGRVMKLEFRGFTTFRLLPAGRSRFRSLRAPLLPACIFGIFRRAWHHHSWGQ